MLLMCRRVVVGCVMPLLLCPHCVVVPVVHGGVVIVWSSRGGGVDGPTVVVLLHGCVFHHCVASVVGHVSGWLSTGWLSLCCLIIPHGHGHVVITVCMATWPLFVHWGCLLGR